MKHDPDEDVNIYSELIMYALQRLLKLNNMCLTEGRYDNNLKINQLYSDSSYTHHMINEPTLNLISILLSYDDNEAPFTVNNVQRVY